MPTPSTALTPEEIQAAQEAWQNMTEWRASQYQPKKQTYEQGIRYLANLYRAAHITTLAPILPQLLSLKGQPFSLEEHFPFEPLYNLHIPQNFLLKCGRQVAKSTNLAALGILQSAVLPYFNTIYVTPLFEQIRRFSSNYVRVLINESPIRSALISESSAGAQNVLQRTMANKSIMFFTFCFTDAERVRGISADCLKMDEIQDINWDFLPILQHCISASKFGGGTISMSGTPKTSENTIQRLWDKSSQGEWVVPCTCGYWNTCTINLDLNKMIQKHGLCCAKCGNLVNPSLGHYEHQVKDPDVIRDFPALHVPQVILPMHYDVQKYGPAKWGKIWAQKNSIEQAKYYNECLGESCDVATKLVTLSDLQAVSKLPWNNSTEEGLRELHTQRYSHTTMGVDWGGGAGGIVRRVRGILVVEGGSASFTVLTILGWLPANPQPRVLYAERLSTAMSSHAEIKRILTLFNMFRCYRIGHDFGGSGALREAMMLQAGFPPMLVFPCQYVPAMTGSMVQHKPPTNASGRNYYAVDKARSLALLCQLIKVKGCHFPKWESIRDLAEDFLALIEDKRDRPSGADIFLINRDPSKSDDFCHATNFGCIAHWHSQQHFPDLAELYKMQMTHEEMMQIYPDRASIDAGWNDKSS